VPAGNEWPAPGPTWIAAQLLRQAEQARAAIETALSQLVPEGKRPGVRFGRHPNVQIAHIVARCPAEDGVTERDFRKRDEQKPGSASM
jgi:hypothetical protein